VRPGDLLHADQHGILTIPAEIAAEVPGVAARLQQEEQKVIGLCRSGNFSVSKLSDVMKNRFKETL